MMPKLYLDVVVVITPHLGAFFFTAKQCFCFPTKPVKLAYPEGVEVVPHITTSVRPTLAKRCSGMTVNTRECSK